MNKRTFGVLVSLFVCGLTPACVAESGEDVGSADEALSKKADPRGAPYPVVLLHGMAGFGKLKVGGVTLSYFEGVATDLARHGEAAYVTVVPPFATSETRARALAPQIDAILRRTGKAKVNLVAHSQGGLDARLLASPHGLGYGDRVASITTIATPHRGTRVADAVLGLLDDLPAELVDEVTTTLLGVLERTSYELDSDPDLRAQLVNLSTHYMQTVFNPTYVDDPRVVYTSYAGRTNLATGLLACRGSVYGNDPFAIDVVRPTLLASAVFLEASGLKINDGLVTVDSARWGTFGQCIPADHVREVGHSGPSLSFDHLAFFRAIVGRLRSARL